MRGRFPGGSARERLTDWWLVRTMVCALLVAAWCWARLRPAARERFSRNQRPGDRAAAAYDAMARRADQAARQGGGHDG